MADLIISSVDHRHGRSSIFVYMRGLPQSRKNTILELNSLSPPGAHAKSAMTARGCYVGQVNYAIQALRQTFLKRRLLGTGKISSSTAATIGLSRQGDAHQAMLDESLASFTFLYYICALHSLVGTPIQFPLSVQQISISLKRFAKKHREANACLVPQLTLANSHNFLEGLGHGIFSDVFLNLFLTRLVLHSKSHKQKLLCALTTPCDSLFSGDSELDSSHCVVHVAETEVGSFQVTVSTHSLAIQRRVSTFQGDCGEGSVMVDFFLTLLVDDDTVVETMPPPSNTWDTPLRSIHSPRNAQDICSTARVDSLELFSSGFIGNRVGSAHGEDAVPKLLGPRSDSLSLSDNTSPPLSRSSYTTCNFVDKFALGTLPRPYATGVARPRIECWKRYCTAVALYLAMVRAGVCEGEGLPFFAVQLVAWGDLLADAETRVELKMFPRRCSARAQFILEKSRECSEELVPVAITLPVARKGILRSSSLPLARVQQGCGSGGSSPLYSVASQTFTDAEIFQLFYLQLIFRAFFDVRFPHLSCAWRDTALKTTTANTETGRIHPRLRTDRIGACYFFKEGLAFEHPKAVDVCLIFPAQSRTLMILDLEHAVIPLYATQEELESTAELPLFGATSELPCQTRFGYSVVEWAATKLIDSPLAAARVLEGLFEQFRALYGRSRDITRGALVPLRRFRCGEQETLAWLRANSSPLSRFLVEVSLQGEEASPGARTRTGSRPSNVPIFDQVATASTAAAGFTAMRPSFDSMRAEINANGTSTATKDLFHSSSMVCSGSSSARTSFLRDGARVCALATDRDAVLLTAAVKDGVVQDSKWGPAHVVQAAGPITTQGSLLKRWRQYTRDGLISIFDGLTSDIELTESIGSGGSSVVFRGLYGQRRQPVAVKVFVISDGMSHERYVRESLTDVAFFMLLNQLDDFGIVCTCRAHDFIVSAVQPAGLGDEDLKMAYRGRDPRSTKLCYLVTDLMDGTLGRFLGEGEKDYDPFYDTLVNSPLCDAELFQFLFFQLVSKSLFDWKILDLMLNGQLRGDNIGFRYVRPPVGDVQPHCADAETKSAGIATRSYYEGILVAFQSCEEDTVRYLRFPALSEGTASALKPLRFIFFIDVGQGIQSSVAELTQKNLIGETLVDSCVQDDGFGRYWPLNELYCRNVEVQGALGKMVADKIGGVCVESQEDAQRYLCELFNLYYPIYGVEQPTEVELSTYALYRWSPEVICALKSAYVYRPES